MEPFNTSFRGWICFRAWLFRESFHWDEHTAKNTWFLKCETLNGDKNVLIIQNTNTNPWNFPKNDSNKKVLKVWCFSNTASWVGTDKKVLMQRFSSSAIPFISQERGWIRLQLADWRVRPLSSEPGPRFYAHTRHIKPEFAALNILNFQRPDSPYTKFIWYFFAPFPRRYLLEI